MKAWASVCLWGGSAKLMTLHKPNLFLMQEGFGTGQTVVVDGGTVLV